MYGVARLHVHIQVFDCNGLGLEAVRQLHFPFVTGEYRVMTDVAIVAEHLCTTDEGVLYAEVR